MLRYKISKEIPLRETIQIWSSILRRAIVPTKIELWIQIQRKYLKIMNYCVKIQSGKNRQKLFQRGTIPPPKKWIQVRISTLKINFLGRNSSPIMLKIKTSSLYHSEALNITEMGINSTVETNMSTWVQIGTYQITHLVEPTRCKVWKKRKVAHAKTLNAWSYIANALLGESIVGCIVTAQIVRTIAITSKKEPRLYLIF